MNRPGGKAPVALLRCDATEAVGVGHLVRCLALAQALRRSGATDVHLAGEVSADLGRTMLVGGPLRMHEPAHDLESLFRLAHRVGASVVHVDHYEGFHELRSMGRTYGIVTSTATDDRFGRRDADVIVDGSPRALREFDPLYAQASVGLGPAYLALREELAVVEPPVARSGDLSVLIIMGGTDAAGHGSTIALAVREVSGVARIGVVGTEAPVPVSGHGGVPVETVPRRADLAALIQGWDVVITAAGTTVWELAALGIPMAVVGVAENQRDHYDTLTSRDLAVGLGFLPDRSAIDTHELTAMLADAARRRRMTTEARRLVDGHGAARVVEMWRAAMQDASIADFHVRPAGPQDVGRLYAWRDDPATRDASRSTAPLVWMEHVAWFSSVLGRADRRLFVGISSAEPIGTVRFDRLDEHEWEVSVTVAPAARRRGWAARLVADATTAFRAEAGRAPQLMAVLRSSNHASRSVFAGLGYRLISAVDGWERWASPPSGITADPT
jgi:spore coat polysaccharide biosynthesis predicted glycosyltransferase SpsG